MTARWRASSSDMLPTLPAFAAGGNRHRVMHSGSGLTLSSMLPTVGDLLGLDVVRRGSPQVVAGSGGLGARVRWVHVLELADAAHLLQGGEFVLTTGIALPSEPSLLARYAHDLAAAGVSALAVELGRRYVGTMAAALVRAGGDSGRTPIAFEREGPF